jgi:hypothetical protein
LSNRNQSCFLPYYVPGPVCLDVKPSRARVESTIRLIYVYSTLNGSNELQRAVSRPEGTVLVRLGSGTGSTSNRPLVSGNTSEPRQNTVASGDMHDDAEKWLARSTKASAEVYIPCNFKLPPKEESESHITSRHRIPRHYKLRIGCYIRESPLSHRVTCPSYEPRTSPAFHF